MQNEPTGSPPLPSEQQKDSRAEPQTSQPVDVQPQPPESDPASATKQSSDSTIDKDVDDIAAKESDDVLAAEDEKIAKAFDEQKPNLKQKLLRFIRRWWNNPKARYTTLAGAAILLIGLLSIPPSRYFVLNSVGVRSSVYITALDDSTQQPLKNVQVAIGSQSALSDSDGNVKLAHVKLGTAQIVVSKSAFASVSRKYTVGWGSNPIGNISLTPVGTQYAFSVTDFLSGKPIAKAQASSGEANAQSDDKGKILLTIDKPGDTTLQITINTAGYRDEILSINPDDKTNHNVKLVLARKEVFVSKRSGKYDVYSIDLDGKNERVILAGTGKEQDNIVLAPHPSEEEVALVSTRDNVRNPDGFLLSTLTLIDLKSGQTTKVTQSERIQVVDWINNRLVYVEIAAGSSAANPKRERLMSYDYQQGTNKELAATNYFNDVLSAGGQVYYASSSAYQNSSNIGLFRSNPDGTNRNSVLAQEVWNIFRTSYDELSVSVPQAWYTYHIGNASPTKTSGAPAELKTRVYLDNPSDKNSLWAESRDGKGVLLLYGLNDKTDKILHTQSGLQYPLRWVNATTVIYRIHTDQETADYALSTQGGNPAKIRDVTNTAGISSWYYY